MSDVLGGNHQDDRENNHNRLKIKFRRGEVGNRKNRRLPNRLEIHDPAEERRRVAGDHCDQNGDDREKLPEQYRAEHRGSQRHQEHDQILRVDDLIQKSRIGGGGSGQLQADERHHRAHGRRRKNHIDPVRTEFIDNSGNHTA